MTTLNSEAYRIAELAHMGVDDDAIWDECQEASIRITDAVYQPGDIYKISERIYKREFESR